MSRWCLASSGATALHREDERPEGAASRSSREKNAARNNQERGRRILRPFSLLWPGDTRQSHTCLTLDAQCARDVGLETTLAALTDGRSGRSPMREALLNLCTDPAVIAYRQDMLDDLCQQPDFTRALETLLPDLNALEAYYGGMDRRRSTLREVIWRLGELEHLVQCVSGLHDAFAQHGGTLRAEGWRSLRDLIDRTAQDAVYQQLTRELPEMLRTIRSTVSVTIGVNLDGQLRPVAATLLSVNDQKFTASSLLDRLFGTAGAKLKGLGPLHTVPRLPQEHASRTQDVNPLMVPLFRDVARVLDTVCHPIARALRHYASLHSTALAALSGDIAFYLAAVRLVQRLRQRGLPVCRPVIAPMTERVCELHEAYNLTLALQQMEHVGARMVSNDVSIGDDGRICLLTGPNQGGKTTYTQMVGLCHILAQAGLWVPAKRARLSPVDAIYTHFPVEEQMARGTGRFGEEAQRLSQIFARATRDSLILLNESLASTAPGESLYIAQDIVRILRRMGTRAIFATHLHDLAANVAELNASTAGESLIVSLVASRGDGGAAGAWGTYKIVPGYPRGRSYAREIASQYGVSYQQLQALLQQRGVVE
jgi:DNA mismatch repair protein MutS